MQRFLCAIVLGSSLVASADESSISLPSWTLLRPDGRTVRITVPSHFHHLLPASPCVYTLQTTVALPAELRGKALTLSIARFEGLTTLRAGGMPADRLDGDAVEIYRASGPQRWRIDATRTAGPQLPLELVVRHNLSRSAWLDTMPRLGTDPLGDPQYRWVRGLNNANAIACLAGVGMVSVLYLLLYLFDRRRAEYGWFALQTVASGLALFYLGWSQLLAGRYDTVLADAILTTASLAAMEFLPAYFKKKPLRVLEASCVVLFVVATIFTAGPFRVHIHQRLTMLVVFVILAYAFLFLTWRSRERAVRADALLLLTAWIALSVLAIPDITAFLGGGELLGGVRTGTLGFIIYCPFQAATLGRAHIRALREADSLNASLRERLRDIGVLNDELRRAIQERSRELADALARIPRQLTGSGNTPRPRDQAVLAAGEVVRGRYRVVRPLGAGGMGAVFEVERLADSRRFAMKVVKQAESGANLARFAREAQIAAHVSHENLVSIADVDVSDTGELFLVMELVGGTSLSGCRERYGDAAWALPILSQIAAGLEALHASGVVHRDLKPANVLLAPGDHGSTQVKIADFGIARIATAPEILPASAQSAEDPTIEQGPDATVARSTGSDLTRTGHVIGTPLYMAPELAGGSKVAPPSSDIWSFGVMAYEMVNGRHPFSVPPVLLALSGQPLPAPPPLQVPSAVSALLSRCLDITPERRPTAAELRAMLTSG